MRTVAVTALVLLACASASAAADVVPDRCLSEGTACSPLWVSTPGVPYPPQCCPDLKCLPTQSSTTTTYYKCTKPKPCVPPGTRCIPFYDTCCKGFSCISFGTRDHWCQDLSGKCLTYGQACEPSPYGLKCCPKLECRRPTPYQRNKVCLTPQKCIPAGSACKLGPVASVKEACCPGSKCTQLTTSQTPICKEL